MEALRVQNELDKLCEGAEGTLYVPGGEHIIDRTLVLPQGVSLKMSPGSVLRASRHFKGDALLETASYGEKENSLWLPQSIEGGVIDGSGLPLTGIRIPKDRETCIRNITVRNCLRKGMEIGVEGDCENNLFNVRVQCNRDVFALKGSIGVHFLKSTDNIVSGLIVIGYETGLRSDTSSNDFHQVHVWNYRENVNLRCCFHCGGWNDSYSQCYADSPMNGSRKAYGFYVAAPFNRIIASRVYGNNWVTPGKVSGIHIARQGTHGTYLGNVFSARKDHEIAKAFDGNLDSATILGNTFDSNISGGRIAMLPSGGGGLSAMPQITLTGDLQPIYKNRSKKGKHHENQ